MIQISRLTVELYDAIGDVNPFLIITDDVPFVDLNDRNGADKAAAVRVVGSRSPIITPIPPIPSQAAPPIRSGP